MLSVRPKITDLNFHLFNQSVHPEMFQVCATHEVQRERYELTSAITIDGHVIRFQAGATRLTEVSAGLHHPLPSRSILLKHAIQGRSENLVRIDDMVSYQTNVHIEIVQPKLFVSVQQQLSQRVEFEGLVHRFGPNGRLSFGAISYIHVQSFLQHALVRAFHTFPESSTVVTSETRITLD